MEKISEKENVTTKESEIFSLLDFIDKEYFKNFLDQIDKIDDNVVRDVEKIINIDVDRMREYIDNRIPTLLEKINDLTRDQKIMILRNNSLRDVLGNSIVTIFERILFVMKNFKSDDPRIRNKIDNPTSVTRKIIKIYSEGEGDAGIASYYIDSLCDDEEKLKAELETVGGYIEKFDKYFYDINSEDSVLKNYPTGAKKLPYFRFFSELEEGLIDEEKIDDELKKLSDNIVNKNKIKNSKLVK